MRIEKITDVLGKKVYTDGGDLFGEIEGANLYENKIDGWKIRVSPHLMSILGGARGVIIPHHFVQAVSDVFIINKAALPSREQELSEESDFM